MIITIYYNFSFQKSTRNMMDEIEIGSKTKYPTIIRFIGFSFYDFKDNQYLTIITEYLPNRSLKDFLNKIKNKENLPDISTKKYIILLGIVLGMKYLHSNNIVHRDLKSVTLIYRIFYQ